MLTFTDQQNLATEITGLTDSISITRFKRDINTGGSMFMALLGRSYNRMSRTTNTLDGQQAYQYPEDAIKISEVIYHTSDSFNPPLEQIADEHTWRYMNQASDIQGEPTHYFVKGFSEIELYPIPNANIIDGLEIVFEPKHVLLTQDDFTTGTVTVVQSNQTVTNSGTNFTATMVGRYFQVTDGTDGNWYRISGFTDTSNLILENYYQGTSGAGKVYRIGEVMNLPDEYQEAPVDYAMYRHFLGTGMMERATEFKQLFEAAKESARDVYGKTTSNNVIYARNYKSTYNPIYDTPLPF